MPIYRQQHGVQSKKSCVATWKWLQFSGKYDPYTEVMCIHV